MAANDWSYEDDSYMDWPAEAWPAFPEFGNSDDEGYAYAQNVTMPHGRAHSAMLHPKQPPHYDGRTSWFAFEEIYCKLTN